MGEFKTDFTKRTLVSAAVAAAFVRGSSATDSSDAELLSTLGVNVPTFYPARSPNRQQYLFNTLWAGAASGSPGTPPTGWTAIVSTGGARTAVTALGDGNSITYQGNGLRIADAITVTVQANTVFCFSVPVSAFTGTLSYQNIISLTSPPAGSVVSYRFNGIPVLATDVIAAAGTIEATLAVAGTAGTVSARIGCGCVSNQTATVTVAYPQFERAFKRSAHIPNASTTRAAFALGSLITALNGPALGADRFNLFKRSIDFSHADWTKTNIHPFGSGSVANAIAAPDGSMTADLLVPAPTPGSVKLISQSAVHSATTHTVSIYAKPAGYKRVGLREGTTSGSYAVVDLVSGATIASSGCTAVVEALADGWYRVAFSLTMAAALQALGVFIIDNAYASGSPHTYFYTADGVSGIYFWGAQDELGSVAREHIETGAAAVVVEQAATGPAAALMMELSRSNTFVRSEDWTAIWANSNITVTANNTTSPFGDSAADLLVPTAASAVHASRQSVSHTSGTQRTVSIFVKAAGYKRIGFRENTVSGSYAVVDISTGMVIDAVTAIVDVEARADGWVRVGFTWPIGVTSSQECAFIIVDDAYVSGSPWVYNWTGDGVSGMYFWGAMNEQSAYMGSYIPTVAASVPRSSSNVGPVLLSDVGLTAQALEFSGAVLIRPNYISSSDMHDFYESIMSFGAEGSVTYIQLRLHMRAGSWLLTRVDAGVQVAEVQSPSPARGFVTNELAFIRWSWGATDGLTLTATVGNRPIASINTAIAAAKAPAVATFTKLALNARVQTGAAVLGSHNSVKLLAAKFWDSALSLRELESLDPSSLIDGVGMSRIAIPIGIGI